MVEKAARTDADAVIYDLQDAVDADRKGVARDVLRELVPTLEYGSTEVCVRINPVGGDHWLADAMAAVDAGVDTVSLPLVEDPSQIRIAVETVGRLAAESDAAGDGTVEPADEEEDAVPECIVILESPSGVFNALEIAEACTTLDPVTGLTFGVSDYARTVGGTPTSRRLREFLNHRIVGTAAVGGLQPISSAYPKVGDADELARIADVADEVGFVGQSVIHPDQVPIVNDAFTPDPAEVEWARTLLRKFDASERGALTVDGVFVDDAIAERYRQVVERADAVAES